MNSPRVGIARALGGTVAVRTPISQRPTPADGWGRPSLGRTPVCPYLTPFVASQDPCCFRI